MPTGVKPDPPNNAIRTAYEGTYRGTTWAVVHWMQAHASVPIAVADLDAVAASLATAFQTNLHFPFCSSNSHFTVTRTTLFLPDSQKRRRVHVADATGNNGGGDLPAQCSSLIDWSTLDGRRGGKPRSYMPALSSDITDESYMIHAASLTSLNGHVASYVAAVNAITHGTIDSLEFVEMSFVTGGAYRALAVTFAIDSGYVRPVLATQRRRVDRQAA